MLVNAYIPRYLFRSPVCTSVEAYARLGKVSRKPQEETKSASGAVLA